MRFHHWRSHFERQRGRARPAIDETTEIPPAWRPALAASLARFQLGETGEGRIVADLQRHARAWGLGPDYLAALRLFVAEEGRHAAILGVAVRALGGRPRSSTWTAVGFARARRLAGPRVELLVLLAAEVAALAFYGTLVDRLPRGSLRSALHEISGDESMHLRFHVAFLGDAIQGPVARRAVALVGGGLGLAAGIVVAIDHGATLHRLGLRRRDLVRRAHGVTVDMVDAIAVGVPSGRKRSGAFIAWRGAPPARSSPPRGSTSIRARIFA